MLIPVNFSSCPKNPFQHDLAASEIVLTTEPGAFKGYARALIPQSSISLYAIEPERRYTIV